MLIKSLLVSIFNKIHDLCKKRDILYREKYLVLKHFVLYCLVQYFKGIQKYCKVFKSRHRQYLE